MEEINTGFKEACVGYQFDSGYIIRIDSERLLSEAVKPALKLLSKAQDSGPRDANIE
jgi:hypothetical protein